MRSLSSAVVAMAIMMAGIAHADNVKDADEKFDAAQKLREQGKPQEACDLFRAALQLNPNAIGTILNVARCAEESGKIGSAVRLFTEARDRAREQHLDPQQQAAEEHLARVVARASHLAITFAEPPTHETRVLVDDQVVDPTNTGNVLVDPGNVKVVISAPGRVPYETDVPVAEAARTSIAVPKLGYPVTVKRTRRTVGKVMFFVGAGVYVSSIVMATIARIEWHDATDNCPTVKGILTCGSNMSGNDYRSAQHWQVVGDAGTGIGIAGIALAGAGAVLWLVLPDQNDERRLAVIPSITRDQAGLVAVGRF